MSFDPNTGHPINPQQAEAMIDPAFTQEPPPRPLVPEIGDIGISQLRPYMTPNGYDTFSTLMVWAIHFQDIVEGNDIEWGPDKINLAVAPFVGFGLPEMWEGVYKHRLMEGLLSLFLRWHRKGKKWQKANPLPWLLLEYKACDFAQTTKGYANAQAIEQLLSTPEFIDKWKPKR